MLKYTEKKNHLRPWRKSFLQIGSVYFCYRVSHLLAPDPDSPLLLKKLESLDSRFRGESEGDDEDDDEKIFAIVFQRLQFGLTGFPFFVVYLCYNHYPPTLQQEREVKGKRNRDWTDLVVRRSRASLYSETGSIICVRRNKALQERDGKENLKDLEEKHSVSRLRMGRREMNESTIVDVLRQQMGSDRRREVIGRRCCGRRIWRRWVAGVGGPTP
ncbi:hypothetical protein U1Q18_008229 [Sarracenia purpurea var. burkii]